MDMSRSQFLQYLQDAAHERLQMDHAVPRTPEDQEADVHCLQVLLMWQAPIHGHRDIETPIWLVEAVLHFWCRTNRRLVPW